MSAMTDVLLLYGYYQCLPDNIQGVKIVLTKTSLADYFGSILLQKWTVYKYVIGSSLLTALCTYLFIFTNKFPNYDDLKFLFGKGYSLTSGRWGLDLLARVLPNYSMPWLHGMLSILLLTLSVCLIVDIFQIKSITLQCLLAALIISFPSEIGTMLYMFTSSSYAVAFLLSVLSVFLFEKKGLYLKILAGIMLILSLSIYQAYIAVAASFLVLRIAQRLLLSEEQPLYIIISQGVYYLIFLGVSLILYYLLTRLFLYYSNETLNDWAMRATSTSDTFFCRLYRSWILFVAVYLKNAFGLVPNGLSMVAHGATLLGIALSYVYIVLREKRFIKNTLLFVLLTVIFPLSVNCLVFILGENGIHGLTMFSFVSVYILAAIIFEQLSHYRLKNLCKDIFVFSMSLIVLCNVYIANKSYLKQYIIYENTTSIHQAVVTQLQMTEGFSSGSKVAIIGNPARTNHVTDAFGEDSVYGLGTYTGESISEYFFTYYLGVDLNYASDQEKQELKKDARIKQMEVYPYYGYIQRIDDYIVVKLGDD